MLEVERDLQRWILSEIDLADVQRISEAEELASIESESRRHLAALGRSLQEESVSAELAVTLEELAGETRRIYEREIKRARTRGRIEALEDAAGWLRREIRTRLDVVQAALDRN